MNTKILGFTLIEVMIALFIFSIVALIAIIGLRNILQTSEVIAQYNDRMGELQMAELVMNRDFNQIVNRSIETTDQKKLSGIMGNLHEIQFTHMGYANPMALFSRGTLQRTEYYIQNQSLIRKTWPVLDRTDKTPSSERTILSGVNDFQVHYFSADGKALNQWQNSNMPIAIQITIQLNNMGTLNRFYAITDLNNAS